jgi:large subunit ribosomal protein L20
MRIKSKAQVRHRKIRKLAKGYHAARHKRAKVAMDAVLHAGQHAYIGRKNKKRDLRALWITRLSAAVKNEGLSYSKFIAGLKKEKIEIDRKILSEIAIKDIKSFRQIVAAVK